MPHKRNPILAERLAGMARLLRGYAHAALEDQALWHERDISHSSVERVIMPDSTILVDYMLARVTDVVKNLIVYPERMKQNLELTGGLVYSQRLLLALIEKGAQRKESYEAVQRNAMTAWKGGVGFKELVNRDAFIVTHLKSSEITACFDPMYYLRHLDQVFRRVFGPGKKAASTRRRRRPV